MFEVRTETEDGELIVETRRISEKDAIQDVDLLKLFGKKGWIVEVS